MDLDWNDNGEGDLDGYNVYRSTESGFAPGAGNLLAAGVNSTGFNDIDQLVDGTTYYYAVTAVDEAANASEPVEIGTLTAPPAPPPSGQPSRRTEPSARAAAPAMPSGRSLNGARSSAGACVRFLYRSSWGRDLTFNSPHPRRAGNGWSRP